MLLELLQLCSEIEKRIKEDGSFVRLWILVYSYGRYYVQVLVVIIRLELYFCIIYNYFNISIPSKGIRFRAPFPLRKQDIGTKEDLPPLRYRCVVNGGGI